MAKLSKHNSPKGQRIRANKLGLATDNEDLDLFSGVKPIEKKCKFMKLPGKDSPRRGKESEYAELIRSKQAMKHYYGMLEKPFKRVYQKASTSQGSTEDNLLQSLELRLDNVVYRAGFASTRAESKQIISHGHILVNDRRVDVSSMHLSLNDVVSIIPRAQKHERIKQAAELHAQRTPVTWLDINDSHTSVTITSMPDLDRLKQIFKVNLVIELYSK